MIPKLLSKINLNEKAAINPEVTQGIIMTAMKNLLSFNVLIQQGGNGKTYFKTENATDPPTNIIDVLTNVVKFGSLRTSKKLSSHANSHSLRIVVIETSCREM